MKDHNSNKNLFLKQLQQGEEKAYSKMVDTYHHMLCAYAISLIHDRDAAEDIVQNVFIQIWKKRKRLGEVENFKSYLYRAVYNEFIDYYRKEKTLLAYELKYAEGMKFLAEEEELDLEELSRVVSREIERLPKRCKEIFLLSRKEGLMNIEIAEHLGISVKNVESFITKAFKILRDKVGEHLKLILFLLFAFPSTNGGTMNLPEISGKPGR